MSQKEELGTTLKEITEKFWDEYKYPLLLSNLPPLLGTQIPEYKTVLDGKSLKSFILESGDLYKYKLIEHPAHRAKIGVVPYNVDFEFPTEPLVTQDHPHDNTSDSTDVVISFFKKLSKLSNEDLEKINIPISVLVKLLK